MPIAMPTSPGFTRSRFGLETNTQTFESPLTRNVQRVMLAGSRWSLSVTLPPMNRMQAGPWQAFLLKLEGRANTFYGYDPDAKLPNGAARNGGYGAPYVSGAGQQGSSLITYGWTPDILTMLRAGDYFEVNGEMKMVTQTVRTDALGGITIPFKPALRSSPADNAPITVINPACEMILADDMQAMWEADKNGIYQPITFTAVEVF